MQTLPHTDRIPMALLAIALSLVATIGAPGPTAAEPRGQSAIVAGGATPAPMVGVFTGEYADGAPVYRLPSINVSVSRTAELARIAGEEKLAHAKRNRAKRVAEAAKTPSGQTTVAASTVR